MMAVLLKGALPAFSAAQILQVLDGLVVLTGAGVFGLQKALYAVVAIVITARVTDMLLEGLNFAKAAYIISDHAEEIAEILLHKLARGVTGIPARGMYSWRPEGYAVLHSGEKTDPCSEGIRFGNRSGSFYDHFGCERSAGGRIFW